MAFGKGRWRDESLLCPIILVTKGLELAGEFVAAFARLSVYGKLFGKYHFPLVDPVPSSRSQAPVGH